MMRCVVTMEINLTVCGKSCNSALPVMKEAIGRGGV